MNKFATFLLMLLVSLTQAQVGVNTANPNASAILDVYSTEKGFLPPRLDDTQVADITDPATGLVVYNTSQDCLQVNTGTPTAPVWECQDGGSGGAPGISGGSCTIEQVAQDTFTDVVDLPPSPTTTRIWMDRNLGATGPYVQGDDDTYGYYYQWGRGADGHELLGSGHTNTTATSHIPGHGDFVRSGPWTLVGGLCFEALYRDGNDPCPDGYRIPTEAELTAEFAPLTSSAAREDHLKNVLKIPPASSRTVISGGTSTSSRGNASNTNTFTLFITEPTTNDVYAVSSSSGFTTGQPAQAVRFTSSFTLDYITLNSNRSAYPIRCIKEL